MAEQQPSFCPDNAPFEASYLPISDETRSEFDHRTVKFNFHGQRLMFTTARTLFAGTGIDAGTALLLRHIQEVTPPEPLHRILDVGAGYGPLGVVLHALGPDRQVVFGDRDALALDYSRLNFVTNNPDADTQGVNPSRYVGSLGVDSVSADADLFDLVVSNIPGKAGQAAITNMVRGAAARARDGAMVGFVVVAPLTDQVEGLLSVSPFTEMTTRASKTHTAFTARIQQRSEQLDEQPPKIEGGFAAGDYDRLQLTFSADKFGWNATTVVGLKEFDSLSHTTALVYDALSGLKRQPLVMANPGQGHRAVLAALSGFDVGCMIDRDLLALQAADRMLARHVDRQPALIHTAEVAKAIPDELAEASVVLHTADKVHTPWLMAETKRILAGMDKDRAQQLVVAGKAGPLGLLEAEVVRRRTARVDYKGSYRGFRALRLVRR